MQFGFGSTITVERPGGQTRHGDRLPATSHTISGCATYPTGSTEDYSTRDTVIDTVTLLTPYGADIMATDVVVLPDGGRYEVDGTPGGFSSPFTGWKPGTRITLRAVSG